VPDTHRDPDHHEAAPVGDPGEAADAADDAVVCPTCGRPKPAGGCGCGSDSPALPEGWTPLAARGDRPKLPMTGKP
jgi:hypothetical protein